MPPTESLGDEIVTLLPRLRRFARSLAGNPADADDLVQLAVEHALARSQQLRTDAPVANWLFGILRNAWIDELRSRGRRNRIFAPEELGDAVADPASDRHETSWSVREAMAQLPPEQREVVALVLVEGLAYREAAELLEVPIGTVTSRLARARETLQRTLAGPGSPS